MAKSGEVTYLTSVATAYYGSDLEYYGDGMEYFAALKESLLRAQSFIFLEFFTLKSGAMLTELLDILEKKAQNGVKIYILSDNIGSLRRISHIDIDRMKKSGIRFGYSIPIMSKWFFRGNNRDHNKIVVIDGHTAFTGGVNISDLYINAAGRDYYWKDGGAKISGPAVRGFSDIFVKMWNLQADSRLKVTYRDANLSSSDSVCIPFLNLPRIMDDERVARNAYLNMINLSEKYLYLITPYFVVDEELTNAICLAAKRGVEIHVILPGRPDHKFVYRVSQSYFERCICAGVHIHLYMPGMIHAKIITADHRSAIIGSINYDYRSMDIDFESGCFTDDAKFVKEIENDCKNIIKSSKEVTPADCKRPDILTILSKILTKQM